MKYINSFLIFAITNLFLLSSCTKDNLSTNVQQDDFKVQNGVLYIKDQIVLDSLASLLESKTDEEKIQWENEIGFKSYNTSYNEIFNEYEAVINEITDLTQLPLMYTFIDIHKDKVDFPGGLIDGIDNYSMEPKFKSPYLSLINENGEIYVSNKKMSLIEKSLKSTVFCGSCFSKTSSRKMWADLSYDGRFFDNNTYTYYELYNVRLKAQKKVLFGWVSYKTTYYCKQPNDETWHSFGKKSSGSNVLLKSNVKFNEILFASAGVGKSRACTINCQY